MRFDYIFYFKYYTLRKEVIYILNQIILVGRLTRDITVNKSDKGVKVATISLAIPRSFKNELGEYDTDFVDCILWKGVAESTVEYCKKGDLIGVKGRIQTNTREDENGDKKTFMNIVAEKVTFLSSKSKENQEQDYSR